MIPGLETIYSIALHVTGYLNEVALGQLRPGGRFPLNGVDEAGQGQAQGAFRPGTAGGLEMNDKLILVRGIPACQAGREERAHVFPCPVDPLPPEGMDFHAAVTGNPKFPQRPV